jgi:threonine/homoserine/homoserine lactone efflux protein
VAEFGAPLIGIADVVFAYLLPGIPFVVVAHRILRDARRHGRACRAGIVATIVILAIPIFWNIAWLLWFAIAVISRGGEFQTRHQRKARRLTKVIVG